MDKKKIPESTAPGNSQRFLQESLADEDLEQVAGGRLSLLNNCSVCNASLKSDVCSNPDCPTNQK